MLSSFTLVAITYLIVKHFIFDFTGLQTPWMYRNKGTYGHRGGIAHSAIHAVTSAPLFLWWSTQAPGEWPGLTHVLQVIGDLMLFEFNVHYHMDWFKMWWCKTKGYSEYIAMWTAPSTIKREPADEFSPHLAVYSNKYFLWLGIDQLVHYLTYVAMIWAWARYMVWAWVR